MRAHRAPGHHSDVAAPQIPLKALHHPTVLNDAKLEILNRLSTERLISSLAPGEPGCLKTRPDGTILDGHHRIHILRERGIDVNALPREVIMKES